jgi:hypothetical protein
VHNREEIETFLARRRAEPFIRKPKKN